VGVHSIAPLRSATLTAFTTRPDFGSDDDFDNPHDEHWLDSG
jgi:hypothetical protein